MSSSISKKERRVITVMFTDLKDSTVYFEKHGDIKGRLLIEKHNRLLFPIVEQYRGVLIKTIGDAIMARFDIPLYGVAAAIEMQRVLKKFNETSKEPIKIRIGLHTGEAIVENSDVFGDTVNLAARIESGTDAESITISKSTLEKIEPFKIIKTSPLGSVKYKGKSDSIETYGVDWTISDISSELFPQDLKPEKGVEISLEKSSKKIIVISAIVIALLIGLPTIYILSQKNKITNSSKKSTQKRGNKNSIGKDFRDRVVNYASSFEGNNIPKSSDWSAHATGFAKMVFLKEDIDITNPREKKGSDGKWLTVAGLMHQYFEENGKIFKNGDPKKGDIIFFDNTYDRNNNKKADDTFTTVGIVSDIDSEGTINFFYYTKNSVKVYQMNLKNPKTEFLTEKNVKKSLNTKMMWRTKQQSDFPELSSELFNSFGSLEK
ncbi:adenylate/guanylate cyclase domain-containing protein [bacterium]|nr:adenylate/guanylate cyclase domain-containing protein [bacterium]